MAFINPTVNDFKAFFVRDFPFGTDPNVAILDADVSRAQSFVNNTTFNPALFCDQNAYNIGFNLLTAHYLVTNLRASSQGLNGQFSFLEQSKSVGAIAQQFGIPQRILDNPDWSMLCKTNYGAMYLQQLIPQLSGQIFPVIGRTKP